MINETRRKFDAWVIDTYNQLHDTLFDGDGKFRMNYMLSGEMLCYLLVKPWKKRVMDLEDIRDEVSQEQVEDIRDYLDNPTMDVQAALVTYFTPTPENYERFLESELGQALSTVLFKYGFPERLRFIKEKKPEKMEVDALEKTIEREFYRVFNVEGFQDLFFHAMDYIDRLNESGEEIPEDMRKLARLLESQDEYYKL